LARFARRLARCRRVQPARRRRQPGEHGLPARALGGARRRAPCLGGRGEAAAADECGVDPPAGLRQRAARRSGFVARRARRGTCGPVRPRLDLVGGGTPIGVRRPRPAGRGAAHARHCARSRRRDGAQLLDGPGVLRRGVAGGGWDSLPYAARYPALRDAGLLPRYYRALEDEVAARATTLRDRVLRQRRDLYFAFRLAQPPADWFTFGLL